MPNAMLATQDYEPGRDLSLAPQYMRNMFAEPAAEGSPHPFHVIPCAGLRKRADITGTGHGVWSPDGAPTTDLLGVWGTDLYKIRASDFKATNLGTVGANDGRRAKFVGNRSYSVVLSGETVHTWNGTTLTKVTDVDLPTQVEDIAYLNSYFIAVEKGSHRFWISDSGDPLSWGATSFASAEDRPDDLVSTVINSEALILIGRASTEVYRPTGISDPLFRAMPGQVWEKGTDARDSVIVADNRVFMVGRDRIVYAFTGQGFQAMSGPGVAADMLRLSDDDAANINARSWVERGMVMVGFDLPGLTTWVLNTATNKWHQRTTYQKTLFEARDVYWWKGRQMACGRNGDLYEIDEAYYTDGTDPIIREWSAELPVGDGRPAVDNVVLWGTSGEGLAGEGDGSDPMIEMRYSDSRGQHWSHWMPRSMGKIGDYDRRIRWNRLGRAKAPSRICHFRHGEPIPFPAQGVGFNMAQP